MGYPKALLPFGSELLVQRVARIALEQTDGLIVVNSSKLELPNLGDKAVVVQDEVPDLGPLEGIRCGLQALTQRAGTTPETTAFVTSCDCPRLRPALVSRLFDLSRSIEPGKSMPEIVVPVGEDFPHPLAAVYRVSVLQPIERLMATGVRRPRALFDVAVTRKVRTSDLLDADPELASFTNMNTPADYFTALAQEGLACPPWLRDQLAGGGSQDPSGAADSQA